MAFVYQFYICPVCYNASDIPQECHEHPMICCDPGVPGHERRRPVIDAGGHIHTRAPRWFLEMVGWITAGYPHNAVSQGG